jgi:hypothetical protein
MIAQRLTLLAIGASVAGVTYTCVAVDAVGAGAFQTRVACAFILV